MLIVPRKSEIAAGIFVCGKVTSVPGSHQVVESTGVHQSPVGIQKGGLVRKCLLHEVFSASPLERAPAVCILRECNPVNWQYWLLSALLTSKKTQRAESGVNLSILRPCSLGLPETAGPKI